MKNNILWISIVLFFTLTSGTIEKTAFETTYFKVGIDSKGFVNSFVDKKTSHEYFPSIKPVPLLSLYKDSTYILPVSFQQNSKKAGEYFIKYQNGSLATIRIDSKGDYLRFELLSLEPRNGIQAVVWGPYPTIINEKIGETVCVVRDQKFAIGLQALNINTIEGVPDRDDSGGVIEPLPGQQLPDSLKDKIGQKVEVNVNVTGDMPEYVRLYRGSAAVKKPYGSELRLFSRDRRIARVIQSKQGDKNYSQYVEPIDVDFAGSAIAMFGCSAPSALDVIGKIEQGERLPHPMLNGVWIKKSTIPGEAYLLNEGDPALSIKYAKACGFKLVHMGDVFQTWGHFGLATPRFPKGAEDIRKATDAARKEGISLGVHTLTMFTTKNDAYVTPVPSDSLCKTGSTVLAKDLGKDDDVVFIKDPTYFKNTGNTHTVKIGKELVNYLKVSTDEPWRLIDCKRAQYGTLAIAHTVGSAIDKLTNDDYSGFFPDINLQDAYSKRLAQVCNETGIDLMDFDGFGGVSPTGHESYGSARFIDLWYKNLDRYPLTCGASTFHYYWHIYAFMNWGEPWYNALRESQVNYRIENQRYFDRNLMPGMLGWFTLSPEFRPEEVEWIQARSAAFNAGYLLRVDENIEKNGYKEQLFEAIREWQNARRANAFTAEQIERMKNPKNEFHLEKRDKNKWELYPVKLNRGYHHKFRMVQTGEPVTSKFIVNNPYQEQPLQFYITLKAVGNDLTATVSYFQFKINDYQTITLNAPLKAGDRVCCDGKKVYLCDKTWNKLSVISSDKIPVCGSGNNEIVATSEFSGDQSPSLDIEFKSVGEPEKVGKW
ncbi:hypothetical protein SAMN05216490_0976 [Mucilaginibacter mallensis]|uniref:Uncharacterized protein n=1 Tax=Mucilaginibacter mallensis TaxID=652787 RepID=A0A1H1RDU0_MUCMA|nr:hypothetical protein [Mucilaginibacter mallensis]SDS33937.1 hypothetical protein SAMN05216490_0976 [Mucilaginibacter mallensis]